MAQLLLLNPRRRRRRKHRSRSRRSTAHLRKFQFRAHANPRRRRRRQLGFASIPSRRRVRAFGRSISLSSGGIVRSVQTGLVGGAGAIAVDLAMGQATKFLPPNLVMRYNAEGGINWGYYGTKAALALGIGWAGQRFLPGGLKRFATAAAEGSLVVMSYELLRTMLPADLALGYFNPAIVNATGNVTSMGKYLAQRPTMRGMGKYLGWGNAGSAASGGPFGSAADTRVGEGPVR